MQTQDQPIFRTAGGLTRLRRRLQNTLDAYQRICVDNEVAATCGESSVWHDSFDYEENQRQMHMLARLIRELRQRAAAVRVVDAARLAPDRACVGAAVTYRVDEGAAQTGWLAGFDDGEAGTGRLSYNSPLGRALLGAVPGEVREWSVGGKMREVELVAVGPGPVDADDGAVELESACENALAA